MILSPSTSLVWHCSNQQGQPKPPGFPCRKPPIHSDAGVEQSWARWFLRGEVPRRGFSNWGFPIEATKAGAPGVSFWPLKNGVNTQNNGLVIPLFKGHGDSRHPQKRHAQFLYPFLFVWWMGGPGLKYGVVCFPKEGPPHSPSSWTSNFWVWTILEVNNLAPIYWESKPMSGILQWMAMKSRWLVTFFVGLHPSQLRTGPDFDHPLGKGTYHASIA